MEKKNLLAWVMKSANELKYGFGLPMNIALRTAWTLFRSCKVVFIKDDGEIREASVISAKIEETKIGTVVRFVEDLGGSIQYRSFIPERLVSSKAL